MKKKLKIGVIARETSATVETELAGEARKRGHEYTRIPFQHADITNAQQVFEEADLLAYDVLYYRTSLGNIWAYALESYLRKRERVAINLSIVEHPYRYYKTHQAIVVAAAGLQVPKTIFNTTGNYQTIVDTLGTPFVVKADVSSQGRDVHLVHSAEEFQLHAAKRAEKEYFYQEFIPHDHDYRVHVVGGRAVGMYKRVPADGDFRTNVSRGGKEVAVDASVQEKAFGPAEQIAKLLGLDICAVDFLPRTNDEELFFAEANLNPGWNADDAAATGVDMSELVIDYFEKLTVAKENNKNVNITQ